MLPSRFASQDTAQRFFVLFNHQPDSNLRTFQAATEAEAIAVGVLKSCQPRSGDEPKHSKVFLNELATQVYLSLLDLDLIPSPPSPTPPTTASKSKASGGRMGRQRKNCLRAGKGNELAKAYVELARRHQATVGGMNEECLILLYVALSCETVCSDGNSPLMSTRGLFTEMAMYPGLKIHPVVNAAASRLLSVSILTVKLNDANKSVPSADPYVYREISLYLGKQLAALDRTRDVGAALDFVNFVYLLTWGRASPLAAAAVTAGLGDAEWVAGLMAVASWPRRSSSDRLQIVCLNAMKNILRSTTPDRFSGEERRAVVRSLFGKIHDLLWGRMGTKSLARAIDPEFDLDGAINCAFEAKAVSSRKVGRRREGRDGFAWARHTVNCAHGGSSVVEWKVALLEGCDALLGLCSASAVSRPIDAVETEEREDVWLFNAKSGRLHSHQFFSRRFDGCSAGDVLTLSVDCDRAVLSISKNGEGFRVAFAGLPRDTDLHPMFILSGDTAVRLSEVVAYARPTATAGTSLPGMREDETGPTEVEACVNGYAPRGEAVAQTVVEVLRHLYERNSDWGEAIEGVVAQTLSDERLLECLGRIAPDAGEEGQEGAAALLGAFAKDRPHSCITASEDLDVIASKTLPALALLADVDRGLKIGSRVSCREDEGIVVRVPELSDAFLPPTIEVYWTSGQFECR